MKKEDIAYQIGAHLEKYFATNSVQLPQTIFEIKQIAEALIDKDSISEFGTKTKFKGNATIVISDTVTNVLTTLKKRSIEGLAVIQDVKNLPEVKSLIITSINLQL